ncbi:MAG: c-type cytochrome [Gemmatimonadetes bacterium]|nr:c-type cytochrome [Gemmatimonadota bacterium]
MSPHAVCAGRSFTRPIGSRRLVLPLLVGLIACGDAESPTNVAPRDAVDLSAVLDLDLANPADYASPDLPAHYAGVPVNTPAGDPVTDEGATLGRVLFYDTQLSLNGTVSCASCHTPETGFTDEERFSVGFEGGRTPAHSMRLGNAVYYEGRTMFWDQRAISLEDQVLQPVQDGVEMGFDASVGGLDSLVSRLENTAHYPVLFEWAFGTSDVTAERMETALAQFIRSMVSADSRFDRALSAAGYTGGPVPQALPGFSADENAGLRLFLEPPDRGGAGCAGCHTPPTLALDPGSGSNGLDAGETVVFKSPSLANVAATGGYMHDGRFATLEEVVRHYSDGVQDGPALDRRLRGPGGQPLRLNLSDDEQAALVTFLSTLTDETFLADERFADPFVR